MCNNVMNTILLLHVCTCTRAICIMSLYTVIKLTQVFIVSVPAKNKWHFLLCCKVGEKVNFAHVICFDHLTKFCPDNIFYLYMYRNFNPVLNRFQTWLAGPCISKKLEGHPIDFTIFQSEGPGSIYGNQLEHIGQ